MSQNPRASLAGNSIHMIRPHLDDIPQMDFPTGFSIRPVQIAEGLIWTDIVLGAEQWLDLSNDLFAKEFGHDLQSVPQRCFFISDEKNTPIGTISSWYRQDYRKLDYGLIHWVYIRPSYQGKGLSKPALSFALQKLALWHERALLGTQAKRLPAINLYLNFGFVPDLTEPGAREDWHLLREQLQHPVLNALDL
jgi:GNAT superfamily N-acetyltransferase